MEITHTKRYRANIDINSNYIDPLLFENINETNQTSFTNEFITYILYVYLSSKFALIGNIEDVLIVKDFTVRNRHNWRSLYLFDEESSEILNFDEFVNDVSIRLKGIIKETYLFNFRSYLSRFLVKSNLTLSEEIDAIELIYPLAESILIREFGLYLDIDGNISFERNTRMSSYEYSYEALNEIGEPSSVSDIYKKVIEMYPDFETDEDRVRASMRRTYGFIPLGKSSIFGLKKWEDELENFKGGTIKEMVADYLQDKPEPVHITIILEYLSSFRDNVYEQNILTNLRVDPDEIFIFYNQSFVGLQSNMHKYNEKYSNLPMQLGKDLIGKHQKGNSILDIVTYISEEYDLSLEQSKLIINRLKYFNEN